MAARVPAAGKILAVIEIDGRNTGGYRVEKSLSQNIVISMDNISALRRGLLNAR